MRSVMKESSWTYNSTNGTLRRSSFRGLSPSSLLDELAMTMTVLTRLITFFFVFFFGILTLDPTCIHKLSNPIPALVFYSQNDSRPAGAGFYFIIIGFDYLQTSESSEASGAERRVPRFV